MGTNVAVYIIRVDCGAAVRGGGLDSLFHNGVDVVGFYIHPCAGTMVSTRTVLALRAEMRS